MAIDFLIFGLLLISFTINLLALGAFWVTPGLRTTANRFTINLLIINLIGCLILAPTLFLSGDSSFNTSISPLSASTSDDSIEYFSKPGNHQMTIRHNGQLVEKEGIILQRNVTNDDNTASPAKEPRTIETIFKCNSTFYQQLTIDESSDTIVITEIEEQQQQPLEPTMDTLLQPPTPYVPPAAMRCWSIDMAAALGALAVLLVVGDTWCAVTDPLRYHSRISGVKAWVLIALTWALGIFFGALSAFRELDFESESVISKQKRFAAPTGEAATAPLQHASESTIYSWYSTSSIFGMIFACIYFVVIILLPFGFVCGMYWRIFSEARENGVRMRQNGSSPLLQSALNLTAQQQQQQHQQQQPQQQQQTQSGAYTNSLCVHRSSLSSASSHGGGLHMCIDQQRKSSPACLRRDSAAKVLLPTISDDGCSDDADADSTHGQLMPVAEQPDRNQNILLTLQSASGEIKRNYSARQLPLLGTSSQDFHETQRLQGIRQVHSSPNLQKYAQLSQDSLSDESGMPQTLGEHTKRPHSHPPLRSHHHHVHHMHHHHPHHHSHVLQIPAIHASPKALSYMSSLRHRLSNASSLFKYREESRAARISILVVIMFLVSYLPYGFLVLLQSRFSAANFAHSTQLAIFMLLLGNLSSPFIFAYRNKRVRRGVKRLFGLDARSRDRHLQRQNSTSGRGSGFLHRHSGNKSGMSIKRTGSKVSTYSSNSCKYLTPQSSVVSNGGVPVATGTLRPNSSCSTIVNLHMGNSGISNNNNNNNHNNSSTHEAAQLSHNNNNNNSYLIASILDEKSNAVGLTRSVRPILQRGITIVEQIPLPNNKLAERRNIFKMFCHSSKSLSCGTQSCAQRVGDNEPTVV